MELKITERIILYPQSVMFELLLKLCPNRNLYLWIKTNKTFLMIPNLWISKLKEHSLEDHLEAQKLRLEKCLWRILINTQLHLLKFLLEAQEKEQHKLKEFELLHTLSPQVHETSNISRVEFQTIQDPKFTIYLFKESMQVSIQQLLQTLPKMQSFCQ